MPVTVEQSKQVEESQQQQRAGSKRKAEVLDLVALADEYEKRVKREEQERKEREERERWLAETRGPLCDTLELDGVKVQPFTRADCSVDIDVTEADGTKRTVHFSELDMLHSEPTERFSSEFRPFAQDLSRGRRRIHQLETMRFRLCRVDDDKLLLWAHESRDPAQEGCAPRTAFLVA